jgi:hypothetical protein
MDKLILTQRIKWWALLDGQRPGSVMCPARLFKLTAMRGFIKQYADADFDSATISILEDAFD